MKRLMIVSMILIAGVAHADDAIPQAPAAVQSSNDAASKSNDDGISIANVHHIDLDTIDVDGGGNWLNKRIWYQKSQAIFDSIHAMVGALADVRVQFSNEVNAIGHKIDLFWETIDYTKGELDDKFKEILVMLDTEQKLLGDLSVDDRNLQTSIKEQLPIIEQIGRDIKSIHDVDDKIDQTLMQAFKTIDECRDYETKSWESFKAIGKELDDKKARNLYYQMSNYKQNIEQKSNYLKSTLLPYLHNVLVAKVEMNISKINEAIDKVKAKGVDIEKIMTKNQDENLIHIRAREKEAAEIAVKKAIEDEQVKAQRAAERAAKALAEAQEQSFHNVVNRYYQATIGKITGFFHGESSPKTTDAHAKPHAGYSFPIFTYMHHGVSFVYGYMQNLVHEIMMYFGSKQVTKKIVAEKVKDTIAEKIEEKIHAVEAAHEKDAAAKSDAGHDAHKDGAPSSPAPATTTTSTTSPLVATTTTTSTTSPLVAPAASQSDNHEAAPADHAVAIQAVQPEDAQAENNKKEDSKNDEQAKAPQNSSYKLFAAVLDFIGAIVSGLYNCALQFFKLIMKLSAFLMSGN